MHVDPGFDSVAPTPVTATAPAGETSIREADFSQRARTRLIGIGARSLEHLSDFTAAELKAIKGFGAVCLKEVREKLAAHGLRLKDDT